MSEDINKMNDKIEEHTTEEINADIPNIHNEEQNIEEVEEHNGEEGEVYNVEEGGEHGEYNIEEGGEEEQFNLENGGEEEEYIVENGGEKIEEDEEGEERVEMEEENNIEEMKNENVEDGKNQNEEENQLNQEQEENEDEDQNELVDYEQPNTNEQNDQKEKENLGEKEELKQEEEKEEPKEEQKTQKKEKEGIPQMQLQNSNSSNPSESNREESLNKNKEKSEKINIIKPKTDLKRNKKAEEPKKENTNKELNPQKIIIVKPKTEIKPKTKEKNKYIKPQIVKPEMKEKNEDNRARHVYHSNNIPNEINQTQKNNITQANNYQFHSTVVTKKKQPQSTSNTSNNIQKTESKSFSKQTTTKQVYNPISMSINKQSDIPPKDNRSNVTKVNVVQSRTQDQAQKQPSRRIHIQPQLKQEQPKKITYIQPQQKQEQQNKRIIIQTQQKQEPPNKRIIIQPQQYKHLKTKTQIQPQQNQEQPKKISQIQPQQHQHNRRIDSQQSTQNKYEPRKYETSKKNKLEIANVVQSSSQRKTQPQAQQPKEVKKKQIIQTTIQNKYQPKKYETSKIVNNISISKDPSNNKSEMVNKNQQPIYNSRTYTNQNKVNPKLKYYVRCPNCGFHLNDESDVNNFNRAFTSEKIAGTSNRRDNYAIYENKTYLRTDKKGKSPENKTTNTSFYNKHAEYNQKASLQNSLRNLQKDKNFIPSQNITYFESSYTKKSKK